MNAKTLDPRPTMESVAAVVVTYHPDSAVAERIQPLCDQVTHVIVVDNGSSVEEFAPLTALALRGLIHVIRNERNRGVATALNQGIEQAAELGAAWALTLDQDSVAGPDVIAAAASMFAEIPTSSVAVIGATWVPCGGPASLGGAVTVVVTSGSLNSVSAWRDIGGFRDDLFIDLVDTEYCLRARSRGYEILQVRRPTITHAIGHPTKHETRFRAFTVTNHDRVRRYYITRNRILVWRAYWRSESAWVARDAWSAFKEMVKLLLFEQDRKTKARAMLRGVRDGVRGAAGELVTPPG